MTLVWRPGFSGLTDADAISYVAAVEQADGQLLEFGVAKAINDFVVGCKLDGIWSAIKASCILAGARTLSGALVPLVGAAPNRNGTEAGWNYNRKTGLAGNGTNNYLNSNRNNNADPQNSSHLAVYKNDSITGANPYWIGSASAGGSVANALGQDGIYSNSSGFVGVNTAGGNLPSYAAIGLHGVSRASASTINAKRPSLSVATYSLNSTTPPSVSNFIFTLNINGSPGNQWSASRLTFYSIGESLNLALLDARVTALISAFAAAIP